MSGYKVDELYYLYRQGCPIARRDLIEYCYWQIRMMMPAYYYTSSLHQDEIEEYQQIVIIRCIKALDNYRPDRGMQVKSFISMVIQNAISSVLVRNHGKIIKERHISYSLDDYCNNDQKIRYIDIIKGGSTPDKLIVEQEHQKRINDFILDICSPLEQAVINYHKLGLKENDIAFKMKKDIRSIYNANYRIQKKLGNSNLFD